MCNTLCQKNVTWQKYTFSATSINNSKCIKPFKKVTPFPFARVNFIDFALIVYLLRNKISMHIDSIHLRHGLARQYPYELWLCRSQNLFNELQKFSPAVSTLSILQHGNKLVSSLIVLLPTRSNLLYLFYGKHIA